MRLGVRGLGIGSVLPPDILGDGGGDGSLRGGVGSGLGSSTSILSGSNESSSSFSSLGFEGPGSGLVNCWAGVGVVPTERSLRKSRDRSGF